MSGKASGRRGRCRYCGHRYALNKDGRVRKHYLRGMTVLCGGSGQVPS